MVSTKLGALKKVNLREIWKSESGDFTPWLAQEENMELLADTIGLDLEVEAREKNVGPFRADILCKDTITGSWVLIENQLEKTDHTHLGQLLTYAAGLSAVTIVWIAEKFTEEHRATIDWLNEITEERFNFFGLEMELWQIADSPYAPKFNIISKPNNWTRTVSNAARQLESGELSETKQLQLQYWTAFREYLIANSKVIKPQKPLPQHWANFAIGKSGFVLISTVHTREKRIEVHLVLNDSNAKQYYKLLHKEKGVIEAELDFSLDWRELPENKESHIETKKFNVDPTNQNDWPTQHEWLKEKLELFHKVFAQRIKKLNLNENDEE